MSHEGIAPLAPSGQARRGPTPRGSLRARISILLILSVLAVGDAQAARHEREVAELRSFEETAGAATDFGAKPPWRAVSGADPFLVHPLPGSPSFVGILRGAGSVVVLDQHGVEQQRLAASPSPTGLVVQGDGDVFVSSEVSPRIALYRWSDGQLRSLGSSELSGVLGVRDLADGDGVLYATDELGGRVLAIDLDGATPVLRELGACQSPIQVVASPPFVVANCLLDHALVIYREDGGEVARIAHDGPLWSVALKRARDGSLLVAAGGVEDHPLERRDGSFGYIDSFVFLYRVAEKATRLAAIDVSALGVVTPKWIDVRQDDGAVQIRVAGYGSDRLVELSLAEDRLESTPAVQARTIPPGTTAIAGGIAANPLLDAWVVLEEGRVQTVHVEPRAPRSVESRIGEALFFTTLMAPWNSSEGRQSRFTCETCHFEGYVDGRTHYTGRADIHATTKPLRGLHGNRPYFSRALDPTLTRMVHNEFRVANKSSGRDPWFSVAKTEQPWLAKIEGVPETLDPVYLRRSLMRFLMDFVHDANPATRERSAWLPLERQGAALFRDSCEGCHAARLVADDPESRVPFERWEDLLLASSGPIVWGRSGYEKTGVTPYVHADGTRVPSLRRLAKKRPYFTNGSAKSLDDVLATASLTSAGFFHDHAPAEGEKLTAEERRALLAFLALL